MGAGGEQTGCLHGKGLVPIVSGGEGVAMDALDETRLTETEEGEAGGRLLLACGGRRVELLDGVLPAVCG